MADTSSQTLLPLTPHGSALLAEALVMAGARDAGAPGPSKPLDYDTVFTNAKVC